MSTEPKVALFRAKDRSVEEVQRFLPLGYAAIRLLDVVDAPWAERFDVRDPQNIFIVVGADRLGWTMEDYVTPRLASGGVFEVRH